MFIFHPDVALRLVVALIPWAAIVVLLITQRTVTDRNCHSKLVPCRPPIAKVCICLMAVVGVAVALWVWAMREFPQQNVTPLASNCIMGMDIDRVVSTVTGQWEGNYRTKVHPLQCLLYQPMGFVVRQSCLDPIRSAQLVTSCAMALSLLFLAVAVWLYTHRWKLTLFASLLYVCCFGFLMHAALPESAALAAPTVILPYLILTRYRNVTFTRRESILYVLARLLALGVTTTNLIHPVVAYSLRNAQRGRGLRSTLKRTAVYVLQVVAIAALLSLLQARLYPGCQLWFLPNAVTEEPRYVSLSKVVSPVAVVDTVAQILVHPVSGPRVVTQASLEQMRVAPKIGASGVSFSEYFPTTICLLIWLIPVIVLAMMRTKRGVVGKCVLISLGFNLLLHMVYGSDFLMYCGNWLPVTCLGLTLLTQHLSRSGRLCAGIALAVLAVNNFMAIKNLSNTIHADSSLLKTHFVTGTPGTSQLSRIFVASTGSLTPGVGTCGIHFAVWEPGQRELSLDSSVGPKASRKLLGGYMPVPMVMSRAGDVSVEETVFPSQRNAAVIRIRLASLGSSCPPYAMVYALVTDKGPAGTAASRRYAWSEETHSVTADGLPVLMSGTQPFGCCGNVRSSDAMAAMRAGVITPEGPNLIERTARRVFKQPRKTENSILICWRVALQPHRQQDLWFYCPVHRDAKGTASSGWEQIGELTADKTSLAGLDVLKADFESLSTVDYWRTTLDSLRVTVPDPAWESTLKAIAGQIMLNIEHDGAPLVTPVNYGVYTRDASYMIYTLLMSGRNDLAKRSIGYLLAHPWSGRPYPEGDAPGQILWLLGQYWSFTHDRVWLNSMHPTITSLIQSLDEARSYGNTSVSLNLLGHTARLDPASVATSIRDGTRLPHLNYGTMDGNGIIYVNAFSIAGLKSGTELLRVLGDRQGAASAERLLNDYTSHFHALLERLDYNYGWDERGQCCILWPCKHEEMSGSVRAFFHRHAHDWSSDASKWPYLDIDEAHNALLTGDRAAGWMTADRYLRRPSCASWRTLDEGGPSDEGSWISLATSPSWQYNVAMPHGWSLASLFALMRDSLVYESNGQCHLLGGVPKAWFRSGKRIDLELPTEYGMLRFRMVCMGRSAKISIKPGCRPPAGFVVHFAGKSGERQYHLSCPSSRGEAKHLTLPL